MGFAYNRPWCCAAVCDARALLVATLDPWHTVRVETAGTAGVGPAGASVGQQTPAERTGPVAIQRWILSRAGVRVSVRLRGLRWRWFCRGDGRCCGLRVRRPVVVEKREVRLSFGGVACQVEWPTGRERKKEEKRETENALWLGSGLGLWGGAKSGVG